MESGIKLKNTAGGRGRALSVGHSFIERLRVPLGFNLQQRGQGRFNQDEGGKEVKLDRS